MTKTKLILLSLLGIFILVSPLPTHAQERPFSLVTSPLPIQLSTKPGGSITTDLRVRNASSQPERLKVTLYKFSVNEQSEVALSERQPGDEYFDWVSFSPSVFDAAPGEWKTIKMNINVPSDAGLGYYYAVGFSRTNATAPQPGAATLEGQVITFVLLDVVVPGAKRQLEVVELSSKRSTYEFLPAKLTVKIKNTGNIHLVPKGTIFIKRGDKTMATLSINPGQGNVLPNSTRTFEAEWKDGFPVYVPKVVDGKPVNKADGSTDMRLSWDFSKVPDLRFGKYTAHMVMAYDDGQRDVPVEGQVSFWVVPWRLGIYAILIPLLPSLIVYFIMRRRFRKRLNKERSAKHV